ncbi:uncharacterized protein LOC106180429 isoform X1 [Lingula anatina]|uniref:Serine/threonine-protein kinase 11-interacting protein n=1 Tax=Lingula anatina TaxID=7574 RepID=A0A1S3KBP5_LINAN|nr:uncharacterized protein LOC106180429 isoform X1 [Lingula anatina]|eukprot:XP_013419864.1 uncharacterized protein LOC106180429 isoform X1 [Lingula anatina]
MTSGERGVKEDAIYKVKNKYSCMAAASVNTTSVNPRERHTLENLAKLLRDNGDKILDGSSCLSLTTASLAALNRDFRTVCDIDPHQRTFEVLPQRRSSQYDFYDNVQFLHDIVQKTRRLKLLHSHSTLQGSINIGDFRELRWLEIKKVPVHLLAGIQKLRSKLETLVCARSVNKLQDLFETCGGDKSEAWSWSELRVAVLSFNDIQVLDESLRLLPHVQLLDLSHNKIVTTEGYLHYLHDLAHVNFGFNCLTQVPSFTITGRQRVVTLILKSNNLDNIQGIEDLVNLKHLDVADNCLSDHSELGPLIHLTQLHMLCLEGNPLSYHPQYRLLTTRYIPYAVQAHILLDEKKLSKAELAYTRKHGQVFSSSPRGSHDVVYHNDRFTDSRTSTPTVADTYRFEQSGEIARTLTPKGKQKLARKRSKGSLRQTIFSSSDGFDFTDTGGSSKESSRVPDVVTTSTASTPKQENSFPKFFEKQHIETIRSQLGPKWLQSLPTPDPEQQNTEQQQRPLVTDDDLYLTDEQGIEPKRSGVKQVDNVESIQSSANTVKPENKTVVDIHADNHGSSQTESPVLGKQDTVAMATGDGSSSHGNVMAGEAEDLRQMVAMCLEGEASQGGTSSGDKNGTKSRNASGQIYESGKNNHHQINDLESVFPAYRRTSSEYFEPCENESDPFIVSLEDGHQLLVTLSDRYMNEKDLDGAMVEQLDLKLLLSAGVVESGVEGMGTSLISDQDTSRQADSLEKNDRIGAEPGEDETQQTSQLAHMEECSLLLVFDYWKKDRRQRRYLMEDQENAQLFLDHLQPWLDARNRRASLKEMFQCLKCGKEFAKIEAKVKVRREKTKGGSVKEILSCPSCDSEHVVEMEVNFLATAVKEEVRVGSFASTGSAPGPLATSTAPNTPQRPTGRGEAGTGTAVSLPQATTSSPNTSFVSAVETTPGSVLPATAATQSRSEENHSPNTSLTDYSTATEGSGSRSFGSKSYERELRVEDLRVKLFEPQEVEKPSDSSKTSDISSVTLTTGSHSNMSTPRGATSLAADSTFCDSAGRETDQSLQRRGMDDSRTMAESSQSNFPPSEASQYSGRQHSYRRLESGDSDISILSNPSQSSIAVLDSSGAASLASSTTDSDFQGLRRTSLPIRTPAMDLQDGGVMTMSTVAEASPSGSLLTSTCSSMVDSVYERALQESPKKSGLAEEHQIFVKGNIPHDLNSREEGMDVEIVRKEGDYGDLKEVLPDACGSGDQEDQRVQSDQGAWHDEGDKDERDIFHPDESDQSNTTSQDSFRVDSSRDSVEVTSLGVRYNYEDFTQVDHRLKLYLTMSVLQGEEEVQCVLKTSIVQFPKPEEFPGMLLVTSERIYIIKIIKEQSEKLEDALKVVDQQPVTELQFVDIGLGHQSFRLEFGTDGSCYTFLLKDEDRCKRFLALFIGMVQATAFYKSSKLQGISKNNIDTIDNIKNMVLAPHADGAAPYVQVGDGEGGCGEEDDQSNVKFFMGYLRSSGGEEPVSLIIFGKEICVCHQALELPLPRLQVAPGELSKKSQFEVKDKQVITDLLEVTLDTETGNKVTLHFLNEETNEETDWHIAMETTTAVQSLIRAIKLPWEHQMCVELEVNYV